MRGREIYALLDMGAKVNVMDTETMDDLGLRKYFKQETSLIFGLSGTPTSVIGWIKLPIEIPGRKSVRQQCTF